MKYWSYLLAKLAAAGALILVANQALHLAFPHPAVFARDLGYTTAMMLYFLLCSGLLNLILRDQRYRCRSCLRRLRMPVFSGSWPNMLLIGEPRMEYICPYGHGTLKVPEVQIHGPTGPDWERHNDDIWKELAAIEAGGK